MHKQETVTEPYLTTTDVAKLLHVSRITVFNRVKRGLIPARKVGRNYVILREDVEALLGHTVSPQQKDEIDEIVSKAVKEYHSAFRKLGEE